MNGDLDGSARKRSAHNIIRDNPSKSALIRVPLYFGCGRSLLIPWSEMAGLVPNSAKPERFNHKIVAARNPFGLRLLRDAI